MSNIVKTRFAGMLRGLLRRFDDEPSPTPQPVRAAAPRAPAPQRDFPHQSTSSMPPEFSPPVSEKPDEIRLQLQPVLGALPIDLRARIMNANTSGMFISISTEKILSQLAAGAVKITFGELRQLTPGVFANSGGAQDAQLVTLPLSQILTQINPALLPRRAQQKRVEIAGEFSSPFDARGEGLKISTEPVKASPASPPLSRPIAPTPEISIRPVQPLQPVAPPPIPFTESGSVSAPNGNDNYVPAQNLKRNLPPDEAPNPAMPDAPIPFSINAAPSPNPIPFDQSLEPPVFAPLDALSENWPESLRHEIGQLSLAGAQVALPVNLIEPALKRGRVIFSWRHLRSWIKPVSPTASPHDNIELELPLKILAPLFVPRQKAASKPRRKLSVAEEIPNLFFGFPQPHSEPRPPTAPSPVARPVLAPAAESVRPPLKSADAKLADTNFYIWGENGETPRIDPGEYKRPPTERVPQTPHTDFLSRYATPKQIIERAMALPGVAGAVVSLPDGLKVASDVPATLNADTLAAFLPQIFGRVTQCSKELRMGELNNLNFTVGNVPWKIFRVNAVYFAAFGRAGEPLPTAQLAALAGELDRKKQL